MRSQTFFSTLLFVSLFFSTAAFAGGSLGLTDIPRNYGPFKLGMNVKEFSQITGIIPGTCPICIEGEAFATLNDTQMRKLVSEERNANGADFFFLNGELYQVSLTPENNEASTIKDQIARRFSAPAAVAEEPNGMSVAKWEDGTTVFSLNFSDANNEAFSMNLTDWNLSQERAWLESIMLNKTATLN